MLRVRYYAKYTTTYKLDNSITQIILLLKKVERVLKKMRTSSVLQKKVKDCVVSLGFEPMILNTKHSNVSLYDVTEPHGLNYWKAKKK